VVSYLRELSQMSCLLPLHFQGTGSSDLSFPSGMTEYYLLFRFISQTFCNKVTSGHTQKVKSFRSNTQNYKNKQLEYTVERLFKEKW
jgi:hypothetical protein